jgi:hypothetical protein
VEKFIGETHQRSGSNQGVPSSGNGSSGTGLLYRAVQGRATGYASGVSKELRFRLGR